MIDPKIKYTSDGRKVVVIGDLNQTDKIVQEIFITAQGDEIPQGERFVVKNLLDEPAKSYKEKKLEELEAKYEKERKYWDDKINSLLDQKSIAYNALSSRVKWLKNVAKEPREEEFKKVINSISYFLSDSEKWVCVQNYNDWNLVKFNENGIEPLIDRVDRSYNRREFDSMRLLSLYGQSNGSLVFKVSEYSDGSGSDKDVNFFKSKEEGLVFMQNELDKIKEYQYYHLDIANKHNLKLDPEKLDAYLQKIKESLNKQIEETELKLKDLKNRLKNENN
jgi:hypothetical protein